MCSSRKNPYPPHGRSLEIPRGRGVLKVKILEAKYEAKLGFPRGKGGVKQNSFCGGVWIFFGITQWGREIARLNILGGNAYGKFNCILEIFQILETLSVVFLLNDPVLRLKRLVHCTFKFYSADLIVNSLVIVMKIWAFQCLKIKFLAV